MTKIKTFLLTALSGTILVVGAQAQVVLTGTEYTQDFSSLGSGLPTGWQVYTGATSNSLGSTASFTTTATSWGDTAGRFKNFASSDGLSSASSTGAQSDSTLRSLGIRQSGSFGDPGAAFVVEIEDTTGFQNFNMSFQAQMLFVHDRSTTWMIDYRVGNSGAFTNLGSYEDPNVFSSTTIATDFNIANFGSSINNQADIVQIRIWAQSASSGDGSRDSFAITDFSLTYNDTLGPSTTERPTGSGSILYNFNDNVRAVSSDVAAASILGSNLTVELGTPSYASGVSGNALNVSSWSAVTSINDLDLASSNRFAFDLQVAQGLEFSIESLSFDLRRSATGPQQWAIYYSDQADSGFTLLRSGTLVPDGSFVNFFIDDFSQSLLFDGTTYFRFYGFDASSSGGTLRIDNLQFDLNIIPEPSSALLMGVGLLVLALRRRSS